MVYPVNYQGYSVSAQAPYTRVFQGGSNQLAARVIQPSFREVQVPPQDVVQISAGDKIKESCNSEKTGMSTGAKWALGIAGSIAAIYGAVVGHRMLTKPSIEKSCKGFF